MFTSAIRRTAVAILCLLTFTAAACGATVPERADRPAPEPLTTQVAQPTQVASPIEIVLAEPNGPAVTADTSAEDVRSYLASTMTTITDVPGTLARFGPFPAGVPSLADARFTILRVEANVDDFAPAGERLLRTEAHFEYLTSASFEDAKTAHVDSLTATGWTMVQTENDAAADGKKIAFLTFRETAQPEGQSGAASLEVFVGEGERLATIGISFFDKRNADLSGLRAIGGWYLSPFRDGDTRNVSIGVRTAGTSGLIISVGFTERFVGETIASLRPDAASTFDNTPGWTFTEDLSEELFLGVFETMDNSEAAVSLVENGETTAYPNGYTDVTVDIRDVIWLN